MLGHWKWWEADYNSCHFGLLFWVLQEMLGNKSNHKESGNSWKFCLLAKFEKYYNQMDKNVNSFIFFQWSINSVVINVNII